MFKKTDTAFVCFECLKYTVCPRVNTDGTVCILNKNQTIKRTATQVIFLEKGDSYNFERYRFAAITN